MLTLLSSLRNYASKLDGVRLWGASAQRYTTSTESNPLGATSAATQKPMYIKEFQSGLDHVLKIDPTLSPYVDAAAFPSMLVDAPRPDSFSYLLRGIVGQQLSGLAATAINKKLEAAFGDRTPTPKELLAKTPEELREVGLSRAKAVYVQVLAEAYDKGELSDEILLSASDDEVVDKLVSLKGIGPWTAQMFLLFYLQRQDVFSPGDLGIQKGVEKYLKMPGCQDIKRTTHDDIDPEDVRPPGTCKKALSRSWQKKEIRHYDAVASRFKPYRSAFQLIMWRVSDTQLVVEREASDTKPKATKKTTASKKKSVKVDPDTLPKAEDILAAEEETAHGFVEKPAIEALEAALAEGSPGTAKPKRTRQRSSRASAIKAEETDGDAVGVSLPVASKRRRTAKTSG